MITDIVDLVPGLSDNAYLGIRRGRFTLSGDEVKTIFDPVIQEVTNLVKGQIEASCRSIKAVLMVGGFGQNAYLRDCIRQSLARSNIEIMQSPNGYVNCYIPARIIADPADLAKLDCGRQRRLDEGTCINFSDFRICKNQW